MVLSPYQVHHPWLSIILFDNLSFWIAYSAFAHVKLSLLPYSEYISQDYYF